MIDLLTPSTLEELYQNERTRYADTIFDDIEAVLSKHESVLEFMIHNNESFTPDAFLGSEKSFFKEGVEIDDEAFITALRESPVMIDDYLRFQRDIASFHYTALQEKTNNWGEVLKQLAKISDGLTEAEINTLFSKQREHIESDFESLVEEAQDGELSDHEFRVLQQVKSQYETATQREILLHSFEERLNHADSLLNKLSYRDGKEPSVGQYFVYIIRPHQNHLQNKESYTIDFTENTVFTVIGKITEKYTVEDEHGLLEIPEYDFDVIAYDTDILELYESFWVLTRTDEQLTPIYQDSYELYDKNPLGSVETRYECEE